MLCYGVDLQVIKSKIYEIRGQKVMLDRDLAELYGTETKRLKEAVRRNSKRFPGDFMFVLSKEEWDNLRSQFASSSWGGSRYLPYAFTEQGVAMLSSVLGSDAAIEMNISIMRAFVAVRQFLVNVKRPQREVTELCRQIEELRENIKSLEKDHEDYEQHFDDIYLALAQLAATNKEQQRVKRRPIGFVKPEES